MEIRFSEDFEKILIWARDEAQRTGWYNIGPDHLMLAILRHSDNDACRLLESLGIDIGHFKSFIDDGLFKDGSIPFEDNSSIRLNDKARDCLNQSVFGSSRSNCDSVDTLHLLLAITGTCGCISSRFLKEAGYDKTSLSEVAGDYMNMESKQEAEERGLTATNSRAMSAEIERILIQGPGNWKS